MVKGNESDYGTENNNKMVTMIMAEKVTIRTGKIATMWECLLCVKYEC